MEPCLKKGLSEQTVTGSKKADKELKKRKVERRLYQRLSQYYSVQQEEKKEGKRKRKRKEKKEWECPPLLAKGEHGHERPWYQEHSTYQNS